MGTQIDQTEQHRRCVILGGGEILNYKEAAALIEPGDFIICADSGYHHCEPLGVGADLLVGDFDSIGRVPPGIPRHTVPAEKDFTDTALAVDCALGYGCEWLLAAGMWGGRPDHTLGNLQTLARFARRGGRCHITDGVSRCDLLHSHAGNPQTFLLAPRENHYFSVLAFSEQCENVGITGGKYSLERYALRSDEARAVSNEFAGKPVAISWDSGTLLIITTPMNG